jgi:prolyl 4-hydroxylase|tara:strand:+ start:127 stop:696 length:570 start_codon:yes stop_codon:yes gene_type:complete
MEYIYEARDIIPRTLCEEIIEKFENDPNKFKGQVGKDVIKLEIKKTIDLSLHKYMDWKPINDIVEKLLVSTLDTYFNYMIQVVFNGSDSIVRQMFSQNIDVSGFQLQKYSVGDFFHWHVDDKLIEKRILAFILYLNDNESCTEFLNGKLCTPETGKILFFPATWTYTHRGQIIQHGTKYIITGFINECI